MVRRKTAYHIKLLKKFTPYSGLNPPATRCKLDVTATEFCSVCSFEIEFEHDFKCIWRLENGQPAASKALMRRRMRSSMCCVALHYMILIKMVYKSEISNSTFPESFLQDLIRHANLELCGRSKQIFSFISFRAFWWQLIAVTWEMSIQLL